jgi:hypothetical protein
MTLSGDHDHDDMTRTRMRSDTGILSEPAAASYRTFGRGQIRDPRGKHSCLVILMALDFGE